MANHLQYVITVPAANEIMNTQGGENVKGYTLENIELEYESIDNIELARKVESPHNAGRKLSFEHVILMKKTEWTRQIKTDSEEYVYPNIEKVRVTVEGVLKAVYSQGITKPRLYEEARRLFGTGEISHQTLTNFFQDKKFALVIDLRTVNDVSTFGNGAKIQNTQSGILVEITKKVTTANVVCHMFVLSDGFIGIDNGQLTGVQY
ncbi:Hypothetical predicted protein [Paramuricea clavata]|uniref:Uncharacterized protein n=1 Tax=Paramuricea clavata TaxID=317549 RepID=A0A6S7GXX4_PARCT|nr:Hypothetical predicted protein [Paramuricea clavata]